VVTIQKEITRIVSSSGPVNTTITTRFSIGLRCILPGHHTDQHWRFKDLINVSRVQTMLFDVEIVFARVPDKFHEWDIA
jgi:hypothetical protein